LPFPQSKLAIKFFSFCAPSLVTSPLEELKETFKEPAISFKGMGEEFSWSPGPLLWVLSLSSIAASVYFRVITDCDEAFGYWEPLHMLLYGYGFQTWEYSPSYALRSYAYLLLHKVPGLLALGLGKLYAFRFLCLSLGLFSVWCRTRFCRAIGASWGSSAASLAFLLFCFLPGLFNASTAFLPNSFSMNLVMLVWAESLLGRDNRAVFIALMMALIGWPYALVAVLPPLCSIGRIVARTRDGQIVDLPGIGLFKRMEVLIRRTIIAMIFTVFYGLLPTMIIDGYYYGRWLVLPTVNTLVYNLFSRQGPELYGTEPWHYYLRSLLLSFHCMLLPSLLAIFHGSNRRQMVKLMGTAVGYVLLFSLQRHKEERFLYPLFPIVLALSALGLQKLPRIPRRVLLFVSFWASVLRLASLHTFYAGPVILLEDLPAKPATLCYGNLWHRFPGHYHLPAGYRVAMLDHGFKGLLPHYFGSSTSNATPHFNNANAAVSSQFAAESQCDYFIGFEGEMKNSTNVSCRRMLDVGQTSGVMRLANWELVFPGLAKLPWKNVCLQHLTKS